MRKFGFCMEGLEDTFEAIVKETVAKFPKVLYLEIGVGHGWTMKAVTDIILANAKDKTWAAVGIDLPQDWKGTGGHGDCITYVCRDLPAPGLRVVTKPPWTVENNTVSLLVAPSSSVLVNPPFKEIELCLIDGCHAKECVESDFKLVSPLVPVGGTVLFHDATPHQEGGQVQPHCNRPCGVWGALKDMGLIAGTYPGWSKAEFISGDAIKGGVDMAVTRRLKT